MKATFFEYNVAMAGLFTAKANINVVAHNLANAAMPGFSRQYTMQRAARPLSLNNSKGMYGTGSEVYGIGQIRDAYLDRKFWHQKSIKGEYATKNQHLALMETIFNELNDANVMVSFTNFFKRLHDLSENVPDATYRTNVIAAAETLANMVRSNANALIKQQQDINREVADTVTIINSLGNQITSLNKQIFQYEMDGSNANDLRDQRALLVDRLSEFVNIEVMEHDYSSDNFPFNKRFTVMLNGYEFVNHDRYQPLMVVPRNPSPDSQTVYGQTIPAGERRNAMDAPGLYDIYFAHSGAQFNLYSPSLKGSLKGLIDIRDGNNTMGTETEITDFPPIFRNIVNIANPIHTLRANPGDTYRIASVAAAGPMQLVFTPSGGTPVVFDGADSLNRFGTVVSDGAGGFIIQDVTVVGAAGTWSVMAETTVGNYELQVERERLYSTTNYKGIPFYMNKLNTLVRTFARAMNEGLDVNGNAIQGLNGPMTGHINGFDWNGQNLSQLMFTFSITDGNRMGTGDAATDFNWIPRLDANGVQQTDAFGNPLWMLDYSRMDALNFAVNPQLLSDPYLLACSSDPERGQSHNDVILDFQKISTYPSLFKEGRLIDFIIGTMDHLAIDRNQAKNFDANYEEILMQTENQRLSVSGVDINEEMIALIKYQQLYQALAKLVNTINNIYEIMINRLGAF